MPLLRNEKVIERPADQTTITQRYTEESVKFIESNQQKPFFLYLAHSMPHVPLFRSKDFENVSQRGLFGDVIEEIDWSVGQVLENAPQAQTRREHLGYLHQRQRSLAPVQSTGRLRRLVAWRQREYMGRGNA